MDNKEAIQALDPACSFRDELSFPENLQKAVKNAKAFKLPNTLRISRRVIDYSRPVKNVIFAGMGGSAIAGDLARDWLRAEIKIPMESTRGYHLPEYCDQSSVVFLISYSGNTEETLSCMLDALNRGCRVISISSNGALQRVSNILNLPIIGLPKMATARVSLPYLLAPIPYFLAKLDLLSKEKIDKEMTEAIEALDKLSKDYGIEVPFEDNSTKKAALQIFKTIPIIYASEQYRSVSLRFKTQINENCKLPARFDFFPELNHNEIMGWEAPIAILKHYTVILLRSHDEPEEVQVRIETLKKKFFDKKARSTMEIWAHGENLLTRMLHLLFTADMISLYLSVLYQRDPVASQAFQLVKYQVPEKLHSLDRIEQQILKLAV